MNSSKNVAGKDIPITWDSSSANFNMERMLSVLKFDTPYAKQSTLGIGFVISRIEQIVKEVYELFHNELANPMTFFLIRNKIAGRINDELIETGVVRYDPSSIMIAPEDIPLTIVKAKYSKRKDAHAYRLDVDKLMSLLEVVDYTPLPNNPECRVYIRTLIVDIYQKATDNGRIISSNAEVTSIKAEIAKQINEQIILGGMATMKNTDTIMPEENFKAYAIKDFGNGRPERMPAVNLVGAQEVIDYCRLQSALFDEVIAVDEDDNTVFHVVRCIIQFPEEFKGKNILKPMEPTVEVKGDVKHPSDYSELNI